MSLKMSKNCMSEIRVYWKHVLFNQLIVIWWLWNLCYIDMIWSPCIKIMTSIHKTQWHLRTDVVYVCPGNSVSSVTMCIQACYSLLKFEILDSKFVFYRFTSSNVDLHSKLHIMLLIWIPYTTQSVRLGFNFLKCKLRHAFFVYSYYVYNHMDCTSW